MSFFVELPIAAYPESILEQPDAGPALKIGTARATMWTSQLAYDMHNPEKLEAIRAKWRFASMVPMIRDSGPFEVRGLFAERDDVSILSFSGVDPAIWRDLITAADFSLSSFDTHDGFQTAFDSIKDWVVENVRRRPRPNRPLLITGHSLGAAIAALAAEHCHDRQVRPAAVYGFGMPRTGGGRFRDRYNAKLGDRTYRFIYGVDIVARSPPLFLGYRHVGSGLVCEEGQRFANGAAGPTKDDESSSSAVFLPQVSGWLAEFFQQGGTLESTPLQLLYRLAPRSLRDHFPLTYCEALS